VTAPSPLEDLIAGILSSAGNAVLNLDPASAPRLAELEGKTMALRALLPGGREQTFVVTVGAGQLAWVAGADAESQRPNVMVTGRVPDIAALLRNPDHAEGVVIDGDEQVLAAFAAVLTRFHPDLAGPIGNVIGPEAADGLIGLAEAGIAFMKSAADTLEHMARDGAGSAFVAETDFDRLLDRMEGLTLRIDRLNARLALLENARPGKEAQQT
jgi:ubiquinone biosynthesis protein UbiJ